MDGFLSQLGTGGDLTTGHTLSSDPKIMVMSAVALGSAQTVPKPSSLMLAIGFGGLVIMSNHCRKRKLN